MGGNTRSCTTYLAVPIFKGTFLTYNCRGFLNWIGIKYLNRTGFTVDIFLSNSDLAHEINNFSLDINMF